MLPMRLDSPKANLLFTALGNQTRRRILQRLAAKPSRSIAELAKQFNISNTAVSNHAKLLEEAQLIIRTARGKYHSLRTNIRLISELEDWIEKVTRPARHAK